MRDVIYLDIRKKIKSLIRKYDTNNPFELADYLNIAIIFEPLGSINGYYNKQLRMKQIHINSELDRHTQVFTAAHELGHALLHPNANTPFLRNNTGLNLNKYEIEANKFAMELLISDETLLENQEYTTEQLARIFGYSEELIKLRFK